MKKYRCEVCDYIYDPVLGNLVQEGASAGFCNQFRYGAHVRQ